MSNKADLQSFEATHSQESDLQRPSDQCRFNIELEQEEIKPSLNHTDYFDALYHENDDPWDYQNRWYEARKRNICLSLLLKQQHQNVLEIGCSNGVFSQQLAMRSQKLTCIDANSKAIALARARLAALKHVQVIQQRIPTQFPQGQYDLIVIGEILYYLNSAEIEQCLRKIEAVLTDQGSLLCCHWKYPIDGFHLDGSQVHDFLKANIHFKHYLSFQDTDFVADLWTKQALSIAQLEGLTA